MANRLPIPEDIQHLVEKREAADRRSGQDRRPPESVACEALEGKEESSAPTQATGDTDAIDCPPEQRSAGERRTVTRLQGEDTD